MKKLILYIFFTVSMVNYVSAQDPQFAQYYAAPIYLNPAFTGQTEYSRGIVNYRNQWPTLPLPFQTLAASFDHHMYKQKSGIGGLITHDKMGSYTNTDIGMVYSYYFYPNRKTKIRAGLQLDYIRRSAGFSSLIFGDQLDPDFGQISPNSQDNYNGSNTYKNMVSVSAGGLLLKKNAWLGLSVHHINQPNQSVTSERDPLKMKISLNGGYSIRVNRDRGIHNQNVYTLTPTFAYFYQGRFQQLNAGAYLTMEPLILGIWYKGLPFLKSANGFLNQDAISIMAGFKYQGVKFGYSYDITISKLTPSAGGAHEISLSYEFGSHGNVVKKSRGNNKIMYSPYPKL